MLFLKNPDFVIILFSVCSIGQIINLMITNAPEAEGEICWLGGRVCECGWCVVCGVWCVVCGVWCVVWCPSVSCSGFEICLAFFNIEFFNFSNCVSYAGQTIQ